MITATCFYQLGQKYVSHSIFAAFIFYIGQLSDTISSSDVWKDQFPLVSATGIATLYPMGGAL